MTIRLRFILLLMLCTVSSAFSDETFNRFWEAIDEAERLIWVDGLLRGLTFAGAAMIGTVPQSEDAEWHRAVVFGLTTSEDRSAVARTIVMAIEGVARTDTELEWDTDTIVAYALDLMWQVIVRQETGSWP